MESNGQKSASERLAISLVDLDRIEPMLRMRILGGKLDLRTILKLGTDRKEPTPAIAFSCDLLTAATICDILRSHDRAAGDYPTTLYIFKAKAWTRIPNNIVLTRLINGKASLNPEVFAIKVPIVKPIPLQPKPFAR